MKTKKSLTKKLLILFLCFGFFTPTISASKPYIQQENNFATPYSDLLDFEYEN